jgi:uncharacterized protein YbjT (DUF2867 family)
VAGATGLVGQAVLAALLTAKPYAAVLAIGRRRLLEQHPRLVSITVDFTQLPELPPVDDVYIALGTTIKVAGSRQAFRAVDFDAVVAVASAARAAGATRLGVVSAMGADADSAIFYNRVKGEMEQALARIGFETLLITRPSMLDGDRAALAQPTRLGERLSIALMGALKPLIPRNYRAIKAADVARALVAGVTAGKPGERIVLSGAMQPRG